MAGRSRWLAASEKRPSGGVQAHTVVHMTHDHRRARCLEESCNRSITVDLPAPSNPEKVISMARSVQPRVTAHGSPQTGSSSGQRELGTSGE